MGELLVSGRVAGNADGLPLPREEFSLQSVGSDAMNIPESIPL